VADAFLKHAQVYYRHADGTPTSEVGNYYQALRPLLKLYGTTTVADLGPLCLKAVRLKMIEAGWWRRHINDQVACIKHMFKWAVENELAPPSTYHGLLAVSGLKAGRCEARESLPIRPVPEEELAAVLKHASRQIAAMIRLQLLTGMRPGEAGRLLGTSRIVIRCSALISIMVSTSRSDVLAAVLFSSSRADGTSVAFQAEEQSENRVRRWALMTWQQLLQFDTNALADLGCAEEAPAARVTNWSRWVRHIDLIKSEVADCCLFRQQFGVRHRRMAGKHSRKPRGNAVTAHVPSHDERRSLPGRCNPISCWLAGTDCHKAATNPRGLRHTTAIAEGAQRRAHSLTPAAAVTFGSVFAKRGTAYAGWSSLAENSEPVHRGNHNLRVLNPESWTGRTLADSPQLLVGIAVGFLSVLSHDVSSDTHSTGVVENSLAYMVKMMYAVKRRCDSSGCEPRPATGTFRPVAIGAAAEAQSRRSLWFNRSRGKA
jgi:hypothetical protein